MSLILVNCACGHPAMLEAGAVNRARRKGAPIYCTRECSGVFRRKNKTADQRKAEKAEYDRQRRAELADEIRAAKREYHKRAYDPVAAAEARKAKMPRHVEYCRRPEYREWKREYDRQYRAKQEFGPFWEASLLLLDLQAEVLTRATRYEIDLQSGTLNKKQVRRRDYERQIVSR